MAGKLKFPLKMADGAAVRDPEELKEHFDLASILRYYDDGRLAVWLENCYYEDEAQQVRELDPLDPDFKRKLCEILGIRSADVAEMDNSFMSLTGMVNAVSMSEIKEDNRRLNRLRQYTDDDAILNAVDHVVFSQEELVELLEREPEIDVVYLCGNRFAISQSWEKTTFIGVNEPEVYCCRKRNLTEFVIKHAKYSWDASEFYELWHDLAERGNAEAQFNLGEYYSSTKQHENDFHWWRLAAEQGHAYAQYSLGLCYYYNMKDTEEALRWYKLAATRGNLKAQCSLGFCYQYGRGTKKDLQEAVKWLRLAAEQGDPAAQTSLGYCYTDSGWGDEKNWTEAVKWYKQAAEQGYASAQHSLGSCYQRGNGVEKDEQEAVRWYKLAAEQGDKYAQDSLGSCYQYGHGVGKDEREAVKWYRLAAEQGCKFAQSHLGYCYRFGIGVKKDRKEAEKWDGLAAE